MKRRIIYVASPLTALLAALAAFYFWAGSSVWTEAQWSSISRYQTYAFASGEAGEYKIMTYNIGYLSGMSNNKPVHEDHFFYARNMLEVQEYLQRHPVDVAVFQEIDFDSHRSYRIDQLDTIAQTLEFPNAARVVNWDKRYVPFPYWPPSVHFGPMLSGQGTVSMFPIEANRRVQLQSPLHMLFIKKKFYMERLAQVVELAAGGRRLLVINVHFEAFDRETRMLQARQVLDLCREYKDRQPVILLGDFNCVPPDAPKKNGFADEPGTDYSNDDTTALFLNEEGFASALTGVPTFPTDRPDRQLDYIFYTPRWISCKSAYTVPLKSSDHLPVVMAFTFRDPVVTGS